jgi:hypothetical protein
VGSSSSADFLAEAAREPFQWGRSDCFLFAADWVRLRTGYDPASPWRGSYRTALGAARAMRQAGGVLELARIAMAGFAETTEPRDGDVAIVHAALERRKGSPWAAHAAAVRVGAWWVVKTRSGLVGNRPPLITPVTVWRVA